jgi:plasmid stability protein
VAQLVVRKVNPRIVATLRLQAAANGRSVEAEHRAILEKATESRPRKTSLKDLLLAMPEGLGARDLKRTKIRPRPLVL